MASKELIYKDDARRAVLKADPGLAYCIDEVKSVAVVDKLHTVDAVPLEQYNDLREAFIDYVCSGEPSPAPWCKNRNGMCTNGWGHCLPDHFNCQGFNPDGRGVEGG